MQRCTGIRRAAEGCGSRVATSEQAEQKGDKNCPALEMSWQMCLDVVRTTVLDMDDSLTAKGQKRHLEESEKVLTQGRNGLVPGKEVWDSNSGAQWGSWDVGDAGTLGRWRSGQDRLGESR